MLESILLILKNSKEEDRVLIHFVAGVEVLHSTSEVEEEVLEGSIRFMMSFEKINCCLHCEVA